MYANKEANGFNWGKQWNNGISPFTNLGVDAKGNTNYNYLGAALLGGGTGLITWALARLLGLKSGPSLTAGILGALATSLYSIGRQKYGDAFDVTNMDQVKKIFTDPINQRRAANQQRIDSANGRRVIEQARQNRRAKENEVNVNAPADAQMRAEQENILEQQRQAYNTQQPAKNPKAPVKEQQVAQTPVQGNNPNNALANPNASTKTVTQNEPKLAPEQLVTLEQAVADAASKYKYPINLDPNGMNINYYYFGNDGEFNAHESARVKNYARQIRAYKENENYKASAKMGVGTGHPEHRPWFFKAIPKAKPIGDPKRNILTANK